MLEVFLAKVSEHVLVLYTMYVYSWLASADRVCWASAIAELLSCCRVVSVPCACFDRGLEVTDRSWCERCVQELESLQTVVERLWRII